MKHGTQSIVDYNFAPHSFFNIGFRIVFEHIIKPFIGERLSCKKLGYFKDCFTQFLVALFSFKKIKQRIKAVIFAVIKAFKCIIKCLLSENFKLTLIGNTKISCNIERMKIFTDNISAKAVYCRNICTVQKLSLCKQMSVIRIIFKKFVDCRLYSFTHFGSRRPCECYDKKAVNIKGIFLPCNKLYYTLYKHGSFARTGGSRYKHRTVCCIDCIFLLRSPIS